MSEAEYSAWTAEWNMSLLALEHSLRHSIGRQGHWSHRTARPCVDRTPRCGYLLRHGGGDAVTNHTFAATCATRAVRRRCALTCGFCAAAATAQFPAGIPSAESCTLVATRHIAKTGGVSVRDWMLQLEKAGRARFFGPVTWMNHRGRCDGNKRFLHCCHPADTRPVASCEQIPVSEARSAAVQHLAAGDDGVGHRSGGTSHAISSTAHSSSASSSVAALTLLEFHWPDSGLGRWGEPHTFLQMLPRMRPEVLPGCRVVVTTILRDPHTLYPSLQRHQYDAMASYGREALQLRCGCNLTACDVLGFIKAYPNFQSWRLTSPRWLYPPLKHVGHAPMLLAATRLLERLDLVGVFERLDEWLFVVCRLAGLTLCPGLPHLNALHATAKTKGCEPADPVTVAMVVRQHALADVELHAYASERFVGDLRRIGHRLPLQRVAL